MPGARSTDYRTAVGDDREFVDSLCTPHFHSPLHHCDKQLPQRSRRSYYYDRALLHLHPYPPFKRRRRVARPLLRGDFRPRMRATPRVDLQAYSSYNKLGFGRCSEAMHSFATVVKQTKQRLQVKLAKRKWANGCMLLSCTRAEVFWPHTRDY